MGQAIFLDLKGKTVFISGGGAGIGANLTRGFIAQGAMVSYVKRSDASLFCDDVERELGVRPLFMMTGQSLVIDGGVMVTG